MKRAQATYTIKIENDTVSKNVCTTSKRNKKIEEKINEKERKIKNI